MKRKSVVIIIALIIISFGIAFLQFRNNSEAIFINNRIKLYVNSGSVEDLHKLCNTLSSSGDFANKEIYFDDYISLCKENKVPQIQIENSNYLTEAYITSYEAEYCLALLHLNKTQEFETYYSKNFVLDKQINSFYNSLLFDLKNFDWNETQLSHLVSFLENQNYENENLEFQNLCAKFEIYSMLSNNQKAEEYEDMIKKRLIKTESSSDAGQETVYPE